MGIRAIMFRLAALLVLLSSAGDYCAFDLYDSEASMSRPRLVIFSLGHATGPVVAPSTLPDDRCPCCPQHPIAGNHTGEASLDLNHPRGSRHSIVASGKSRHRTATPSLIHIFLTVAVCPIGTFARSFS
jgi:hypothetical protein